MVMRTIEAFLTIAIVGIAVGPTRAVIDPDVRANAGAVPFAIRRIIQSDFAGFSLPTERDLSGLWGSYQTRYSWLPYLVSGDFNDDGLPDYAALLVSADA
jgi:hypothetical protein